MSTESQTPIVIYQEAGQAVEVWLDAEYETVWLNLQQFSEVFGRDKPLIYHHLRNIYKEGELERRARVAKNATVQDESARQVRRQIELYNLDAIISVGYRVNSRRAVQFRQWATWVLREHLTQGWTLNLQRFEENWRGHHWRWTLEGYHQVEPCGSSVVVDVLTPESTVRALLACFRPGVHRSISPSST
ncbi:virulence RhuM family protein [Halomonas ventosae]|uniref:Virulence RhuM family protein n=1 Tax=Halomonas ventosae TaxID=229007 RepID=A0A4R6ZKF7_9GAMM|nr:RhuM family protein [Halomonas ventosae]TDR52722.1 virulence RhuM family protein [Halomonas ventosae]